MSKKYMSDEDFEGLLQGLKEAVAHINGTADNSLFRVHTPQSIELRRIRKNLSMTQKQFAETFGFSVRTIGEWEQGRRVPEASARILLKLIDKEPEMVLRTLRAA
jgi:putative transcriptional regulator